MKKILLAIAIVMTMGFCANAQRDSFFNNWDDVNNGLDRTDSELPSFPSLHGLSTDQDAPLGSGLIILGALGAGYALRKRKENE